MQQNEQLLDLHQTLFAWWRKAGRFLPWREKVIPLNKNADDEVSRVSAPVFSSSLSIRETAFQQYFANELRRDPYRVVVAEIMLQQTQVDRVMNKYLAWMKTWSTIQDLAKAELSDVLRFWQGLGYNRRARFLWLLAKEITDTRKGIWPDTEAELLKLPGIGRYTARAILSFAFGQEVAVVDTNVKRVLRRLFEGHETIDQPTKTEREWFIWADQVLPIGLADPWNQLVMDFGALICTAKAPKCEECPAKQQCLAQKKAEGVGYATYRQMLLAEKKLTDSSFIKKPKIRFEDTDRFFRGRIIDQLRIASRSEEKLEKILSEEFGLSEKTRFTKIVASLITEKLISRQKNKLKLG